MDAKTLRQRSKDDTAAVGTQADDDHNAKRQKLMARRGLRSLAVAVAVPLTLSILSYFLSSPPATAAVPSPMWRPPFWAMHTAAAATAIVMGLAAWLVWAEGGMRTPAVAGLYAAQLALGLAWAPAVIGAGAGRVGLVLSVALVAALAGCARLFRPVNPVAGDLVKPCIAWAVFLAIVSYKMM